MIDPKEINRILNPMMDKPHLPKLEPSPGKTHLTPASPGVKEHQQFQQFQADWDGVGHPRDLSNGLDQSGAVPTDLWK
jgi:hypothetical protein